MSALGYEGLMKALRRGDAAERLYVMPMLDDKQVGPGSIDLRLGTQFIEMHRLAKTHLDPFADEQVLGDALREEVVVSLGDPVALHPGQFILGSTFEFVSMPRDLVGQVLGRSSWGRMGLLVATAVTVQPGFAGCLTLELFNTGTLPILLYPGIRVAQLSVWRLTKGTKRPYRAGELRFKGPLGPKMLHPGWDPEERRKILEIKRLLGREQ